MFDLPMKTSAADLSAVPVPLAGRVMMFAGQGGAPMVRTPDGAFRGFRGYSVLWTAPDSDAGALAANVGAVVLSCPFVAGQLVAGALVPFSLAFWHKPSAAGNLSLNVRVNGGAWVALASVAQTAATSKRSFWVDGNLVVKGTGLLSEFRMFSNAAAAPTWGADTLIAGAVAGQAGTVEFGLAYSVAMAAGGLGVRSACAGVLG